MVFPGLLALAGYYAVFGGEYSWLELREMRRQQTVESAELARLRIEIDSLRGWAEVLETDPALLERLAREEYGMVRDGEVLYRLIQPEDPRADAREGR